jgi:hypothetical protein
MIVFGDDDLGAVADTLDQLRELVLCLEGAHRCSARLHENRLDQQARLVKAESCAAFRAAHPSVIRSRGFFATD